MCYHCFDNKYLRLFNAQNNRTEFKRNRYLLEVARNSAVFSFNSNANIHRLNYFAESDRVIQCTLAAPTEKKKHKAQATTLNYNILKVSQCFTQ